MTSESGCFHSIVAVHCLELEIRAERLQLHIKYITPEGLISSVF